MIELAVNFAQPLDVLTFAPQKASRLCTDIRVMTMESVISQQARGVEKACAFARRFISLVWKSDRLNAPETLI